MGKTGEEMRLYKKMYYLNNKSNLIDYSKSYYTYQKCNGNLTDEMIDTQMTKFLKKYKKHSRSYKDFSTEKIKIAKKKIKISFN